MDRRMGQVGDHGADRAGGPGDEEHADGEERQLGRAVRQVEADDGAIGTRPANRRWRRTTCASRSCGSGGR